MKISICIVYFNRKQLLINTIKSILKFKSNINLELVIVDDASNENNRIEDLIEKYSKKISIKFHRFEVLEKNWSSPVIAHNKSIAMASGDIIIQQGAECMHVHNILEHALKNTNDNNYIVYGCYALSETESENIYNQDINLQSKIFDGINGWYQHSVFRPDNLNFCTSISKNNILKLGGFDERFAYGIGKADREFILRVKRAGLEILPIDNIFVYHQYHELTKYPIVDPNVDVYNKVIKENNINATNSFMI